MTQKKLDSETFLKIVAKSGIVDQKASNRLIEKVREKLGGRLPDNPRKLAALFEKKGLLTPWHSEKLLAGKYKGFFLGSYKLLGHIGTGGMSSVYLAQHVRMGDKRAIKVLPKSRVADSTYLARFKLEAKAIASLNHVNIVLAYDIDNEGDVHYIVMEYVNGLDLQELVKRDGAMDFSMAASVIAQAARGLQHAHSKGVIHRDVKPANLLIDENGIVKLLDMGLALVAAGDDESLTVANNENVLGTADYLAPEQALNSHEVDHRADIYGLGCTLYYLLTGKPPFSDGTLAQRIAKHQTEMPTVIRQLRSDCPGELEGICVKMIQKNPKYRYQTAADVAEVLEKFATAVPVGQKMTKGMGVYTLPEDESSSISLDDLTRPSTIKGDTVTNKNDETLSDSRSKVVQGLSSSDSGRLVDVTSKADFVEGSFLDLQLESGYRPNSTVGRNDDSAGSNLSPPSFDIEDGSKSSAGKLHINPASGSDVLSASTQPGASGARSSKLGSSNASRSSPGHHSKSHRKPMDPMLVGALLTALFLVALGIGFFLARITS